MATLADLVTSIDALRLVEPPAKRDATLEEVIILDADDAASPRAGSLVLAVSTAHDDETALTLADRAAAACAVAIVFRSADGRLSAGLRDRCCRLGLGVVASPADMRWEQLLQLVHVAMTPSLAPAGIYEVGSDLFALADAIAEATGAPVTIEDPRWRLLAYANLDHPVDEARRLTILGRIPPKEWRARLEGAGITQRLRSSDAAFRVQLGHAGARIVAPVRAGGELLGSLWLLETDGVTSDTAGAELERFAGLAAVHMIAHRAAEDIRRRARATSMRELFEGRIPSGHTLALRSRGPFTVAAFAPEAAWEGDPARILSIVSLYAEDLDADTICTVLGERYWALLPIVRPDALASFATTVQERVQRRTGVRLTAALGASAATVADIPSSRRSAERVLEVLSRGTERIGHADDLRAQIQLLDVLGFLVKLPGFTGGPVARLAQVDEELVATLQAFLAAHGDIRAAAVARGVHPNTLRYRLKRIQEACGLDLGDHDARLLADLEARLLQHESTR